MGDVLSGALSGLGTAVTVTARGRARERELESSDERFRLQFENMLARTEIDRQRLAITTENNRRAIDREIERTKREDLKFTLSMAEQLKDPDAVLALMGGAGVRTEFSRDTIAGFIDASAAAREQTGQENVENLAKETFIREIGTLDPGLSGPLLDGIISGQMSFTDAAAAMAQMRQQQLAAGAGQAQFSPAERNALQKGMADFIQRRARRATDDFGKEITARLPNGEIDWLTPEDQVRFELLRDEWRRATGTEFSSEDLQLIDEELNRLQQEGKPAVVPEPKGRIDRALSGPTGQATGELIGDIVSGTGRALFGGVPGVEFAQPSKLKDVGTIDILKELLKPRPRAAVQPESVLGNPFEAVSDLGAGLAQRDPTGFVNRIGADPTLPPGFNAQELLAAPQALQNLFGQGRR